MARQSAGGRADNGPRALSPATVRQLEQIREDAAVRIAKLEAQLDRVRAQQREAEEQLRGIEATGRCWQCGSPLDRDACPHGLPEVCDACCRRRHLGTPTLTQRRESANRYKLTRFGA